MDRPSLPPPGDLLTTLRRTPTADGAGQRRYLLVLEGDSSTFFPLPPSGEVLIGRGSEATLQLADGVASRRHARLLLSGAAAGSQRGTDTALAIEDLQSSNGTFVNGERLSGVRPLRSGDQITIGDVILIFTAGRDPAPPRPPQPLQTLGPRLLEEVARCLRFQRPLALFLVALPPGLAQRSAADALSARLRPTDLLGTLGDARAMLLVLRPECPPGAAPRVAAELLRGLGSGAAQARVGFALCPDDGCDADTLVAAARAATLVAADGGVAAATDSVTRLTMEGRTILCADPAMARLFELIRRLAQSELPVLLSGETGVGKENAAFAVHYYSPRQRRPFVAINCAAIHESLVEAELFGHERGAFSGAVGARAGLFETASGGTVFLDEVGELSPSVQAKLLRVLEQRRITRVGDVRERDVDIRVVAATNRDLEREVREGRFRQDLFFRLSAATVILPPLRERQREIPLLARAFLASASQRLTREPPALSTATLQRLASYAWPGNVRELRNTMDLLAATVDEELIEPWHLPERLAPQRPGPGDSEDSEDSDEGEDDQAGDEAADEPADLAGPPPDGGAASTNAPQRPRRFRPIAEELRELERRRMVEALREAAGVRRKAAALIAMPIRTFNLKVKQYDITAQAHELRRPSGA